MSETVDAFTIAGAIGSIGGALAAGVGAIIAWKQANKAKGFARQAEQQVSGHRRTSELSRLESLWNNVEFHMKPYGLKSNKKAIAGKKLSSAVSAVFDYLEEANKCKSSLGAINGANDSIVSLRSQLDIFNSHTGNQDEINSSGFELWHNLSDFNASIHSALNKEKETVHLT